MGKLTFPNLFAYFPNFETRKYRATVKSLDSLTNFKNLAKVFINFYKVNAFIFWWELNIYIYIYICILNFTTVSSEWRSKMQNSKILNENNTIYRRIKDGSFKHHLINLIRYFIFYESLFLQISGHMTFGVYARTSRNCKQTDNNANTKNLQSSLYCKFKFHMIELVKPICHDTSPNAEISSFIFQEKNSIIKGITMLIPTMW